MIGLWKAFSKGIISKGKHPSQPTKSTKSRESLQPQNLFRRFYRGGKRGKGDKAGEASKSCLLWPWWPRTKVGFYSNCDGKPLKAFRPRNEIIWFTFLKEHIDAIIGKHVECDSVVRQTWTWILTLSLHSLNLFCSVETITVFTSQGKVRSRTDSICKVLSPMPGP